MNQLQLPKSSWALLVDILFQLKLDPDTAINASDQLLLKQLKYLNDDGALSDLGKQICLLEFVTKDAAAADQIHHDAVLMLPATQMLLQSLWGTKDIGLEQVKNAFLFAGLSQRILDKRLVTFLQILNRHGILVYGRKNRSVKLLVGPLKPGQQYAPPHIYVDRSRPYSNDFLIREIIREAQGTLMWLDKYFQKEAFEWLWREADVSKITAIKIVSSLGDEPIDKHSADDFKRFKTELEAKGISVEWRTLVRSQSHDFHDRWILDDQGLCYNLPSIGSIKSGQRSELHRSPHHETIQSVFEGYFSAGTPVKKS